MNLLSSIFDKITFEGNIQTEGYIYNELVIINLDKIAFEGNIQTEGHTYNELFIINPFSRMN